MRIILALILALGLAVRAEAQFQPLRFSHEEALVLANQLLAAVNPDNPQNWYMPPFLKDKIRWLYIEIASGRIKLNYASGYFKNSAGQEMKASLMSISPDGKVIDISAPRLLMLVRVQHKMTTGYNDPAKDMFAIALAHEAIHFEALPVSLDPASILREEDRTWRKMIVELVRPLRAIGRKLDTDFLAADDILRSCEDRSPCPAFTEFLTTGDRTTVNGAFKKPLKR